jgi:3-deoxy-manno-octulosonate cytidylyltransferase (CMP-KDO synthetase)
MKAVAVVPARYASVRFPAKPLVDILGKPMIQRTYEQTSKAKTISRVIVATDDERISTVVSGFGGEVIMTSSDLRSGTDRVAQAARSIEADIILNVQGDEPFISPEAIDIAVESLANESKANISTLIKLIEVEKEIFDPNIVKVVFNYNMYAMYFSRSPIPFVRDSVNYSDWLSEKKFYKHIGLYAYKKEALHRFSELEETIYEKLEKLEQLRALHYGFLIKVAITDYDGISIDTPADLERIKIKFPI